MPILAAGFQTLYHRPSTFDPPKCGFFDFSPHRKDQSREAASFQYFPQTPRRPHVLVCAADAPIRRAMFPNSRGVSWLSAGISQYVAATPGGFEP